MFAVLIVYADNLGLNDAKKKPRGFALIDDNHPGGVFRDHEILEEDAWTFNAWLKSECGIDTGLRPNHRTIVGADKVTVLAYPLNTAQTMALKLQWLKSR